ncbi:MAG TPA: STAS domain-containing protein [Solirubrobacteraceae bacterium]|nr:STAS domain-containing protein [Solirubrobacteraceae bacterium]
MDTSPNSKSSRFSCDTRSVSAQTVRVTAVGELDLESAPLLEAELAAVDSGVTVVVLDLSALRFMDSSGLQVIVRANQRLREHNRRLTLVRGQSQIQRLFLLSGLEPHFQFVPDAGE